MLPPITSRQGDLTKLEDELRMMAQTESELVIRLQSLRTSMQERRSHLIELRKLCSTIDALPTKVIADIFQAGLPPAPESPEGDPGVSWLYGLHLSQVSRSWRQVAINTPSLWTLIHIRATLSPLIPLRLVELFVERSQMQPLDIYILLGGNDDVMISVMAQVLCITARASRLRNIIICGYIPRYVYEVCCPFRRSHVPLLERFKVVVSDEYFTGYDDEEDFTRRLRIFEGGAPSLTHVTIEGLPLTSCYPPLTSVTSLRLSNPSQLLTANEFREAVTASNHLASLLLKGAITTLQQTTSLATERSPIVMASLRSLHVSPDQPRLLSSILGSVQNPVLESLTVNCALSALYVNELNTSIQTTDCSVIYPALRTLAFDYADFAESRANFIVERLTSITHLSVHMSRSPSVLLGLLLPSVGAFEGLKHGNGWPNLRVIDIRPLPPTDLDVLCKVISYRISCGRPIETIKTYSYSLDEIPADRLVWLRERVRVEY